MVVEALAAMPRTGDFIFPGRFRGPCSPATIWEWTREVGLDAGVGPIKTHWTRHTALATQNDATGDLRTVQHFAGHSKPETTSGYTRTTNRRLLAAVQAIDYGS